MRGLFNHSIIMKYINKIQHINCSPEFLKDPKNIEFLEKLCKAAYHHKFKTKKKKAK